MSLFWFFCCCCCCLFFVPLVDHFAFFILTYIFRSFSSVVDTPSHIHTWRTCYKTVHKTKKWMLITCVLCISWMYAILWARMLRRISETGIMNLSAMKAAIMMLKMFNFRNCCTHIDINDKTWFKSNVTNSFCLCLLCWRTIWSALNGVLSRCYKVSSCWNRLIGAWMLC